MKVLFIFLLLVHSSLAVCPNGSIVIPSSLGSKWGCVSIIPSLNSFMMAELQCQQHNGHLISIPNGFVNIWLAQEVQSVSFGETSNLTSKHWIGVSNLNENGWQNIDDNSNTPYFDWVSGEPVNQTESNGCVSVDLKGGWYNDDCFTSYSFVCEITEVGMTTTQNPDFSLTTGVNNWATYSIYNFTYYKAQYGAVTGRVWFDSSDINTATTNILNANQARFTQLYLLFGCDVDEAFFKTVTDFLSLNSIKIDRMFINMRYCNNFNETKATINMVEKNGFLAGIHTTEIAYNSICPTTCTDFTHYPLFWMEYTDVADLTTGWKEFGGWKEPDLHEYWTDQISALYVQK